MINKRRVALLIIIATVIIFAPISYAFAHTDRDDAGDDGEAVVLTLWQVDSFEGGKGSRAQYLSNAAKEVFDGERVYVEVVSLSAQAVRENLAAGNSPDMLSYGDGLYGAESYLSSYSGAVRWCRGGYCFLALGEGADFSKVSSENTVINEGRDNLSCVAAALEGVYGANFALPTSAYVQLINGKYEYLLGTQRDIYRLKTRGVSFSVKPVESFNDLYQNISIVSTSAEKYSVCKRFINGLVERSDNLTAVGMFFDGVKMYDDELSAMEEVKAELGVNALCGEEYISKLKKYASEGDVNNLKKLLK